MRVESPKFETTRILFVCLGNICRSPAAEAATRHLAAERGLPGIEVDSAGTSGWHVGEPPDPRMVRAASRRGIRLEGRARRIRPEDFDLFDLVIAMDRSNLTELRRIAPAERTERLRLLRAFDPEAGAGAEVPDPYYGDDSAFDEVMEIILRSCTRLLDHVTQDPPHRRKADWAT
ncbi:MAG: acid phosphatase [Acidimicrobiales bacterium]|nr:MAG: acid phosphatase [Acidimicrobiales bacterium]